MSPIIIKEINKFNSKRNLTFRRNRKNNKIKYLMSNKIEAKAKNKIIPINLEFHKRKKSCKKFPKNNRNLMNNS